MGSVTKTCQAFMGGRASIAFFSAPSPHGISTNGFRPSAPSADGLKINEHK